MSASATVAGGAAVQGRSAAMPLRQTPALQEYLAATSNWGDEELEPIRPWWRRLKRVRSGLDGAMIWKVEPLSDAQLIWLARCLQMDEKHRLDRFWKQLIEVPLQPAVDAMKEIHDRPRRLLRRPGRHTGRLGDDALEAELSRLFMSRLFDLALEAVGSMPEPKRDHASGIAAQIFSGLVDPCLVEQGSLKDHFYNFLPLIAGHVRKGLPPLQAEAFEKAPVEAIVGVLSEGVAAALSRNLRKDRSRAFWITFEIWGRIGEPIDVRSLRRLLKRPAHLRPVPDLTRRPIA